MMVNSYIVCTYATYDVFIYINKQSVLTRLDRSRIQWSLSLYIKHRLNMNRLKTRSLPAPCPVKRHFYRRVIFVSDEIFLKYYNSRKTPSWKWRWRHLAALSDTFIALLYLLVTKSFLNIITREKPQVGSGGGGIWKRLQPLFRPVLLEVTVNYYYGLEYLHSSLHFLKNRLVEQMQL